MTPLYPPHTYFGHLVARAWGPTLRSLCLVGLWGILGAGSAPSRAGEPNTAAIPTSAKGVSDIQALVLDRPLTVCLVNYAGATGLPLEPLRVAVALEARKADHASTVKVRAVSPQVECDVGLTVRVTLWPASVVDIEAGSLRRRIQLDGEEASRRVDEVAREAVALLLEVDSEAQAQPSDLVAPPLSQVPGVRRVASGGLGGAASSENTTAVWWAFGLSAEVQDRAGVNTRVGIDLAAGLTISTTLDIGLWGTIFPEQSIRLGFSESGADMVLFAGYNLHVGNNVDIRLRGGLGVSYRESVLEGTWSDVVGVLRTEAEVRWRFTKVLHAAVVFGGRIFMAGTDVWAGDVRDVVIRAPIASGNIGFHLGVTL